MQDEQPFKSKEINSFISNLESEYSPQDKSQETLVALESALIQFTSICESLDELVLNRDARNYAKRALSELERLVDMQKNSVKIN